MIDAETQQELRYRFNPDGSPLRFQQLRMLDILCYIDAICKENNIKYWLSSGTLIGAVRHGGFIPWDDDLDIEMLREDYLKFEKVFRENDDFALQTYKNDKYYINAFAKVRDKRSKINQLGYNNHCKYEGLFVDVFNLEKIPHIVYFAYGGVFYLLIQLHRKCSKNRRLLPIVSFVKKFLFSTIGISRYFSKFIPLRSLHHTYGSAPFWGKRYPEDIFPLGVLSFEGIDFPVPGDYDRYLRNIYGDYTKLPDTKSIRIHCSECEFIED